ncbi:uncharacterized protein LOC143588983 [Bidens hawaiensis]|uniref:uncharacterized protein LOC143588983 n=1 Tax=Bidens hawaiensis TaxID=980011 RepID=UPI00404AC0B5
MTISFQENTNNMRLLFFIFFGFLGAHKTLARYVVENPLVKPSSSDELSRVAGYGDEKLSTVVVSGSVLCDVCMDKNDLQSLPIPGMLFNYYIGISGASIAVSVGIPNPTVSCVTKKKTSKSDWITGTTDEYGDFLIDLPSHLHAIPAMENKCCTRIINLPKDSPCYQAFTGRHEKITLLSTDNGFRAYRS